MKPSPVVRALTESKPSLDEVLPVVMQPKTVEVMCCPHCRQEIHEKHTFSENGVDRHRDCGGAIKFPAMDWSKIDPVWRAALEPHMKG